MAYQIVPNMALPLSKCMGFGRRGVWPTVIWVMGCKSLRTNLVDPYGSYGLSRVWVKTVNPKIYIQGRLYTCLSEVASRMDLTLSLGSLLLRTKSGVVEV